MSAPDVERFEQFIRSMTDPAEGAIGYQEWEYEDGTSMRSAAIAWFAAHDALAARVVELEAERALLIADVCRVGKETCPYCGITLAGGKCEECDWPRRYSLELETAAKVFAAPPPDAPTEPTQ